MSNKIENGRYHHNSITKKLILNQKQHSGSYNSHRPTSSSASSINVESFINTTKGTSNDTLTEEVMALKHRLKSCEDKMSKSIGSTRQSSKKMLNDTDSKIKNFSGIKSEFTRAEEILKIKSKTTPKLPLMMSIKKNEQIGLVECLKSRNKELRKEKEVIQKEFEILKKSTRATFLSELENRLNLQDKEINRQKSIIRYLVEKLEKSEKTILKYKQESEFRIMHSPKKKFPIITEDNIKKTLNVLQEAHMILMQHASAVKCRIPVMVSSEKQPEYKKTPAAMQILMFLRAHVSRMKSEICYVKELNGNANQNQGKIKGFGKKFKNREEKMKYLKECYFGDLEEQNKNEIKVEEGKAEERKELNSNNGQLALNEVKVGDKEQEKRTKCECDLKERININVVNRTEVYSDNVTIKTSTMTDNDGQHKEEQKPVIIINSNEKNKNNEIKEDSNELEKNMKIEFEDLDIGNDDVIETGEINEENDYDDEFDDEFINSKNEDDFKLENAIDVEKDDLNYDDDKFEDLVVVDDNCEIVKDEDICEQDEIEIDKHYRIKDNFEIKEEDEIENINENLELISSTNETVIEDNLISSTNEEIALNEKEDVSLISTNEEIALNEKEDISLISTNEEIALNEKEDVSLISTNEKEISIDDKKELESTEIENIVVTEEERVDETHCEEIDNKEHNIELNEIEKRELDIDVIKTEEKGQGNNQEIAKEIITEIINEKIEYNNEVKLNENQNEIEIKDIVNEIFNKIIENKKESKNEELTLETEKVVVNNNEVTNQIKKEIEQLNEDIKINFEITDSKYVKLNFISESEVKIEDDEIQQINEEEHINVLFEIKEGKINISFSSSNF